jgi:hypothetical protein
MTGTEGDWQTFPTLEKTVIGPVVDRLKAEGMLLFQRQPTLRHGLARH